MDRRYKKKMQRYWARELESAKSSIDNLDFTSWFDLWHTHIDWKARGNRYPESRAEVARATYDLLLYAEQAGADRQRDLWGQVLHRAFECTMQDPALNAPARWRNV